MTDIKLVIRRDLDQLIELPADLQPDWGDITGRVGRSCHDAAFATRSSRLTRGIRRRPVLALLIVLVAALIPVSALAVRESDPWWFLRFNQSPAPATGTGVVVIKRGSWKGQGWVLSAFRNTSGSLCFQLTPTENGRPSLHGGGGAENCGLIPGRTTSGPNPQRIDITYLSGNIPLASGRGGARYLVGPVVSAATTVKITLANRTTIATPTFNAPTALGMPLRFYATQLPSGSTTAGAQLSCRQATLRDARQAPSKIVGLDQSGRTVATLAIPQQPRSFLLARCLPHRNEFVIPPDVPAAGRALRIVGRVTGPFRAMATLAIGTPVPITGYRGLPFGPRTRVTELNRCWRVRFSNGQSQGTCLPETRRTNPRYLLDYLEVQHAGRDTFVIAHVASRTGSAVSRVTLQLANGRTLNTKPINGVAVVAIPADALSTKRSQRGFLHGYDSSGDQLGRQPVYYRSCPPGSRCY